MKGKNAIVAQSGGPTPVINSSLYGVITGLRSYPGKVLKIFGANFGVLGILKEELIELSDVPEKELELLKTTPGAGVIGTSRYKLKEENREDFERIIDVFRAHDIGYFFYIGGNDSMDTANKISELAKKRGLDVVCTGIPKTIDNDLGDSGFEIIDHTPGYGSTARYFANYIRCANEENKGSCKDDPVLVIQAMGRRIGFIPASARLADLERNIPLLILMAESGFTLEEVVFKINAKLKEWGRVIVVISEGFNIEISGVLKDSFGHVQFGSSRQTVAQNLVNFLNENRLVVRGRARFNIPGTDQRSAIAFASKVDIEEAFNLGVHATEIAMTHGTGFMSTIKRKKGEKYEVYYDKVELSVVANSERKFPESWLSADRTDVTDDFVFYALPLIGEEPLEVPVENGLFRFAKIEKKLVPKKLEPYVPQAFRS